ncbi:MAG: hypothetical protein JWQ11_4607, partial [Rhizobacter sp.]|nr:hypothetical protein [Rhizobacter sp.]
VDTVDRPEGSELDSQSFRAQYGQSQRPINAEPVDHFTRKLLGGGNGLLASGRTPGRPLLVCCVFERSLGSCIVRTVVGLHIDLRTLNNRASPPMIPPRPSIAAAIRNRPSQNIQYCGFMSANPSCSSM